MKDEIKEIKVNKENKSITFINNGIAFSQFGIADEILDLITNLQEELKYQKEAELEYNEKHTELMNMYSGLKAENETLRSDFKNQVECATNLQEENERLKELEHDYRVELKLTARYEKRIEKAIKYIKKYSIYHNDAGEYYTAYFFAEEYDNLLNILEGSDKE